MNTRAVMLLTLGLMTCSLMTDMGRFLLFALDELGRVAALIRIPGRAVRGQTPGRRLDEALDRVGDVDFVDRAVAALNPQIVGGEQHVGAGEAFRRVELPARELDEQPQRI